MSLSPQTVGGHHGVPQSGHQHRLLSPGGRAGRSSHRRGALVLLRPNSRHLKEGARRGKKELQIVLLLKAPGGDSGINGMT